jgi:phosphate:Na+ symporter
MMHDITEYLIRCSTNELSDTHAATITSMIRIVAEFEEISDCEFRLVKLMERKVQKQHDMNPEVISALRDHAKVVSEFIDFYSSKLFQPISAADLKEANRLENAIDEQRRLINRAAMKRMQEAGDIKAEMLNVDLSNQLEKIGNHALNVIETAHEMSQH